MHETPFNPASYERTLEDHVTRTLRAIAAGPPPSLGEVGKSLLHGTTIGAMTIEGGAKAIAFSDGQVSMGTKPAHRGYRKILGIDHHTVMLISGSPSLGIANQRALKTIIGFREDTSGHPMTARGKISKLSRLLMGSLSLMHVGIVCAPILVTYDIGGKQKVRIFSLGPDGSETEHNEPTRGYATSGSGYNVDVYLMDRWRADMTEAEGIALVRTVINHVAPNIDVMSGGQLSLDVIDRDGVRTIQ